MIKKKRIRSLSNYGFVTENSSFVLGVPLTDELCEKAIKYGFSNEFELGSSILPKSIGASSRRNANGKYVLRRDLEKEEYSYTLEWTRKQWAGNGDTEEVTNFIDITRKRYQREIISLYNNYLTIVEKNNEKYVVTKEFNLKNDSEDEIIHTTNLILEVFGYCDIYSLDLDPFLSPKVVKLDWQIFPEGEAIVWEKVNQYVENIIKPTKRKKNVVQFRLSKLKQFGFDPIAVGNAGFNGYIVFRYRDSNLFFFENPRINNATYVFNSNWEELTKLSKGEIINNDLHINRIIHNKAWEDDIKKILEDY